MRVLVVGRTGQLARGLAERAAAIPGLELTALGRDALDLTDLDAPAREVPRHAPDVVINAAAYTAVDQAEDDVDLAMRINGEAPGALAAAATKVGARLIHVSTDYVFDGRLNRPYVETDATDPLGVYGRSKAAGEEAVRATGGDWTIVRTAWVYSPFGRNFLKTMLAAAGAKPELSVVADQRGNPTSALDLADALLALAAGRRNAPGMGQGSTYHIAGTGNASWAEFAETIFAEAARHGLSAARVNAIGSADWPTRALRPRNSTLDGGKFARDFGRRLPDWRASTAATVARLAREGAAAG